MCTINAAIWMGNLGNLPQAYPMFLVILPAMLECYAKDLMAIKCSENQSSADD